MNILNNKIKYHNYSCDLSKNITCENSNINVIIKKKLKY